ncbi:MAG: zinc ribbon domain-containing protein [Cyanobacteria bacterium P01_F01_bin.150]
MSEFFRCPICGTEVSSKARSCPECGADEETGWSDAAQYTHLLPDRGDQGEYQPSVWRQYMFPIAAMVGLSGFLMIGGFFWAALLVPLVIGCIRFIPGLVNRSSKADRGLERQAYEQLVRRAAGDRSMANRLIDFERQRSPNATRLQLIQDALFRWDRDRR